MTRTAHDPIELLREALETQLHQYTDRLTELAVSKRQPDGGGHDADMLAELIASCRQTVSDTAQALQRMAEGTYGVCERCEADIPLPRLEILPMRGSVCRARVPIPPDAGRPRSTVRRQVILVPSDGRARPAIVPPESWVWDRVHDGGQ